MDLKLIGFQSCIKLFYVNYEGKKRVSVLENRQVRGCGSLDRIQCQKGQRNENQARGEDIEFTFS